MRRIIYDKTMTLLSFNEDRFVIAVKPEDKCSLIPYINSERTVVLKFVNTREPREKTTLDNEDKYCKLIESKNYDLHNNRFGCWFPMHNFSVLGSDIRNNFPECRIGLYEHVKYEVRYSPYMGIDMEALIISGPRGSCIGCGKRETLGYTMTAKYTLIFIKHILESLLKLGNITHNDLFLRNILVNPTPDEVKAKTLQTSLPRIIDFGSAEESKDIDKNYYGDFHDLFNVCPHGMVDIARIRREYPLDHDAINNWLFYAVIPEQRDQIMDILMLLNNLNHTHTISVLLEMVTMKLDSVL